VPLRHHKTFGGKHGFALQTSLQLVECNCMVVCKSILKHESASSHSFRTASLRGEIDADWMTRKVPGWIDINSILFEIRWKKTKARLSGLPDQAPFSSSES
jgi:hypothetical protein